MESKKGYTSVDKTEEDELEQDFYGSYPGLSPIQEEIEEYSPTNSYHPGNLRKFEVEEIKNLKVNSPDIDTSLQPFTNFKLHNEKEQISEPNSKDELFPLTDDPLANVLTVRSFLVGLLEGALGAAITQLFMFKPINLHIQPLFLQITCMLLGRLFALIPGPKWWNPGPFGLKETVFAAIMSTTASGGALAIEMIVTQDLFFNRVTRLPVAFMILFSSQMIGYGWAGLLQPILVYPAKLTFPHVLPSAALFYSMSGDGKRTKDQMKFFKKIFGAIAIYEIFPSYIMPALQGISLFCLASPKSPLVTNLFGGVEPQEGLGFLSLSLDWSFIGHWGPLFLPLLSQLHRIAGLIIALFIFSLSYTNSWFSGGISRSFPFLSVSLLSANGTEYPIRKVIGLDGVKDSATVNDIGLPFYTSTYVVSQLLMTISAGSALSHVFLHQWDVVYDALRARESSENQDPHRLIVKASYRDFPNLFFIGISGFAIAIAIAASIIEHSDISVLGLLVAIGISSFMTLAVAFVAGVTGSYIRLGGAIPMIGGFLYPGNTFGNMWFSTGSTVHQAVHMLNDLKLGQYMHMPPIYVVLAQIFGTILGLIINVPLMFSIVSSQRNVLLLPHGNGVFSGLIFQEMQAHAVRKVESSLIWGAFSEELYSHGKKYFIIPLSLAIGFLLPCVFFLADKIFPNRYLDSVNIPLLAGFIGSAPHGVTAGNTVNIIVGLISQFWLRKYHSGWFKKYNYVLSAALDGGTQVTIFCISLFFQGVIVPKLQMPNYFLNPSRPTPKDYCYLKPTNSRLEVEETFIFNTDNKLDM
ncbi:putative oligopeptide transporter [Phakopsora pachyrhizi]|uniref:Oligopeptide transporter n=1 Tax=Phakopsora pachyrhizi TaxID=170000 RepID=A0AAV0BAE0_PHAPC|nr:putative oligopeptide transporter [Phakopsora pachyrhizi]CAH7684195.1 putative oligopeptide transporter [Phakopsora pachyrhizi]